MNNYKTLEELIIKYDKKVMKLEQENKQLKEELKEHKKCIDEQNEELYRRFNSLDKATTLNSVFENILTELDEEINLIIQHYKELRKKPFEDSVFKNDMLRQSFITSIEGYFQNLLDTIQELKEKYI